MVDVSHTQTKDLREFSHYAKCLFFIFIEWKIHDSISKILQLNKLYTLHGAHLHVLYFFLCQLSFIILRPMGNYIWYKKLYRKRESSLKHWRLPKWRNIQRVLVLTIDLPNATSWDTRPSCVERQSRPHRWTKPLLSSQRHLSCSISPP